MKVLSPEAWQTKYGVLEECYAVALVQNVPVAFSDYGLADMPAVGK